MNIFGPSPVSEPFQIFDGVHLVTLAIIVGIILFIFYGWKNPSEETRKRVKIILAVVLVVNEIAWHAWNYASGFWTLQTMLPLHVCSMLVWTGAYMVLTRNNFIYEYMYFLGIGGAMQALLTPDLGAYGFPHFRFFQTFISHGLLVIVPIYMTKIEGMRPTWKSLLRVAIGINIYLVLVYFVNISIGSNYMFTVSKPPTESLLDMMGPWPVYLLGMEAIGLVVCLLLYLPFALKDWRSKKTLAPAIQA